jgi:hypothetical protein
MGHTRLGSLPRTRKCTQVVGLIETGARAAQVANATITAAENVLGTVAKDKGVVETVWLLTQLPLAARDEDFAAALRECGLTVPNSPGLMDIVGAVSDAIDERLPNCSGRSDLGEMAQMAAAETLIEVIGARTSGLFGAAPSDVQKAFATLATVKPRTGCSGAVAGATTACTAGRRPAARTRPCCRTSSASGSLQFPPLEPSQAGRSSKRWPSERRPGGGAERSGGAGAEIDPRGRRTSISTRERSERPAVFSAEFMSDLSRANISRSITSSLRHRPLGVASFQ